MTDPRAALAPVHWKTRYENLIAGMPPPVLETELRNVMHARNEDNLTDAEMAELDFKINALNKLLHERRHPRKLTPLSTLVKKVDEEDRVRCVVA
jgi:hypothetical protein